MSTAPADHLWSPQPQAANLVADLLADHLDRSPFARTLRDRLLAETGTRLLDWVARIVVPKDPAIEHRLAAAGYQDDSGVWTHPDGLFPVVEPDTGPRQVALRVESVADFVLANGLAETVAVEGEPLAATRGARVAADDGWETWVEEQNGGLDRSPDPAAILRHAEAFRLRKRKFPDSADGFAHARALIAAAITDLGRDRTCSLFFAAEREFWQLRNRAARVQKARQDALGLGWGNHDHHTYRSSREHFAPLIRVLEDLGFVCRERFYAGREAGWGAQVLEQSAVGVVIFADVDLSPEEVAGDFAHDPLPPRAELGTVGLWCQLHGEAFLEAGMHHLECRFDFDAVRDQLRGLGIESMKPFTDFPFLKQAFTKGETWPVAPERVAALERAGRITAAQAEKFRTAGAIGSHLEVLQRDDGYKGFNQTGINDIIRSTDPRRQGAG